MKLKVLTAALLFVWLIAPGGFPGLARASDDQALEELLEVLEKKETLSPGEAEGVKKLLQEKQAREAAPGDSAAAKDEGLTLRASLQDGLRLAAKDPKIFSLSLGGIIQTDYRYFDYKNQNPGRNEFDLRRAQVILQGQALKYLAFRFLLEFEGANARNLLDGYMDVRLFEFLKLRAGQFKEPFGLESNTADVQIFFAEKSMSYHLTPQRDVGAMLHGSAWEDRLNYGVGAFNGNGRDGAASGDEDEPQLAARLVLAPFRKLGVDFLENFQFGGSYGHGRIDRSSVSVKVATNGRTEFFNASSPLKSVAVQDAKIRDRYGLEAAWAVGPVLVMGEWIRLHYREIKTASDKFDLILDDYYLAALVMLTGERPGLKGGLPQRINPAHGLLEGGFGALGLAARVDVFKAGPKAYDRVINKGVSVKSARAVTGSLIWSPFSQLRLLVDFTRTEFDARLLVHTDALSNTAFYCDREDALTVRLTFDF
ncbi:MAG: porin [Pseudomonadota bacterium]